MNDSETRAELERMDRIHPVGKDDRTLCELLDDANDIWIPGSNAIEMFRLLAESQRALREIIALEGQFTAGQTTGERAIQLAKTHCKEE